MDAGRIDETRGAKRKDVGVGALFLGSVVLSAFYLVLCAWYLGSF